MKAAIAIIFSLFLVTAYGQVDNYQVLLDSAKTLFKSERGFDQDELDKFDYTQIVTILEKVIALKPDNAEAHYFLGYAYSRINSRDGRSMIDMSLELVKKMSEQFEIINTLTPKYTGEIILLDPYSKLTSEWGSMAMSYWHNNKKDSAIWAFKEGKGRGGFDNFILEANRKVLDACSSNAILISSGDNLTIPLWYLQIVEGYRKDVSVIDVSLLNTIWYPSYLSQNKIVTFDVPDEVLDTLEYIPWTDSIITINKFSWTVKPSFYDQYILRGDRIFLSLLRQNKFQRDVYFTMAFIEESRLSLKNYLTNLIVVDKLTPSGKQVKNLEEYKKAIIDVLQTQKNLNMNSIDERRFYDYFRYNLFDMVSYYTDRYDKEKARELIKLLDKYADEKKIPYTDDAGKEYADLLRKQL